ncbi:MAG TPA: tetratricopeptide repeat protein [Thermoanaerobaculia bacterium]|nr:tetratricopeptide repeat protein [Thermoanaerobaculia bacterium]
MCVAIFPLLVASCATGPTESARSSNDRQTLRTHASFQLFRQLDKPGARATFERLRRLEPEDAEVLRSLAALYADAREWPQAIAAAEALVRQSPNSAEALDTKAEVLLAAGQFDPAEAAFREALAVDRGFAPAYSGLASVKLYREDWDAAVAAVEQGIASVEEVAERDTLTALLGWIQLAADRPEEARATLKQALAKRALDSGFSMIDLNLAIERQSWTEAQTAAAAVLADAERVNAPAHPRRWITLLQVIASSRAGDLEAAERGLASLEAGSGSLEPWITKDLSFARGHVALAKRETDLAVASFTDRWVLNHNSLFDPGRGNPQPSLGQFALKGKLLAAEALAQAGRTAEAARILDELASTYHRGIGAVMVHQQALQARRAIGEFAGEEAFR